MLCIRPYLPEPFFFFLPFVLVCKVLNMKPPEILAMIEEAAGTRMFEDKKDSAIKTIEKKEKKLEEIDTVSKKPTPFFSLLLLHSQITSLSHCF